MRGRLIGRLPLAVWLVNVLAAVLSYFMNMMWAALPLFAAVMVVWMPAVRRIRKKTRAGQPCFREKPPAWVITAAVVSVIYTFVNFFLCTIQLWQGGPVEVDGVYCLWNHGFIREISHTEYLRLQTAEGRMFVGHMLAFTGLSMFILWPGSGKPDGDKSKGGTRG